MIKPGRPRRRGVDVIDVGFRVFGSMGGLSLSLLLIALLATSETRGVGWVFAAAATAVPMAVALVFALSSWVALRDDRRAVRAGRMHMDFSPPGARVRPGCDERSTS